MRHLLCCKKRLMPVHLEFTVNASPGERLGTALFYCRETAARNEPLPRRAPSTWVSDTAASFHVPVSLLESVTCNVPLLLLVSPAMGTPLIFKNIQLELNIKGN